MRLITYLQSLATDYSPRVHANGFIQIDITPVVRLHVWGDVRIPRQVVATPIHNHAFGFTSRVLAGTLNHRTYRVEPSVASGQHLYRPHVARVRHGEDTILLPTGSVVTIVAEASQYIAPGESADAVYSMEPGEFHKTVPLGSAVSVIVKRGRTLSQGGSSPTVLVPVDVTPSNEFDRHAALRFGEMWDIVADVIAIDVASVATGIAWALQQESGSYRRILDVIAHMSPGIAEGDAADEARKAIG